jgi:hypothetical protein
MSMEISCKTRGALHRLAQHSSRPPAPPNPDVELSHGQENCHYPHLISGELKALVEIDRVLEQPVGHSIKGSRA